MAFLPDIANAAGKEGCIFTVQDLSLQVCRRRSVMFSVHKVLKTIVGHLGEIFSCLSIIQKGKGPVVGLHSSSSHLLLIQDTPLISQLTFLLEPHPIHFMLIPSFPVHVSVGSWPFETEEAAIQKSKHK